MLCWGVHVLLLLCLQIWSLWSNEVVIKIEGHKMGVTSIAFNSNGKLIATGGEDGMAMIWRPEGDPSRQLQVTELTSPVIPLKVRGMDQTVQCQSGWESLIPDSPLILVTCRISQV